MEEVERHYTAAQSTRMGEELAREADTADDTADAGENGDGDDGGQTLAVSVPSELILRTNCKDAA